jgi:hypothetical protein
MWRIFCQIALAESAVDRRRESFGLGSVPVDRIWRSRRALGFPVVALAADVMRGFVALKRLFDLLISAWPLLRQLLFTTLYHAWHSVRGGDTIEDVLLTNLSYKFARVENVRSLHDREKCFEGSSPLVMKISTYNRPIVRKVIDTRN